MKQDLISIKLGESHYYILSDVVTFSLEDYNHFTQKERDNVCTAFNKLGEYPSEILITTHSDGSKSFLGRAKLDLSSIRPGRTPYQYHFRMYEHVREMFEPIKRICDVIESGTNCFVTYEPKYADNEDLKTFENYIKMTR